MPSEKIVCADYGREYVEVVPDESNQPVRSELTSDSFVKVQWHRESGIDVGLCLMRESDDVVDNDRLMVWLDREGVNRLLRVLKRAGGQTFGRDEW